MTIWVLERPDHEGPSDLRFFGTEEAAIAASGLSYLSFTKEKGRLVARDDSIYHYPEFEVWEAEVE